MPAQIKKSEAAIKKNLIIGAYEGDGDWRELAKSLDVPKTTTYRWLRNKDQPDQRGGSKAKKFLDQHKNYCVEQLEINPLITLENSSEFEFQLKCVKRNHSSPLGRCLLFFERYQV